MKNIPPYAPDELLAKYLAGETSPQEAVEVENWLSESKKNRDYFFEMKRSWEAVGVVKESDLRMIDQAWVNLQSKIEEGDTKVRPLFPTYLKVAVAALVIMVFSFGLMQWMGNQEIEMIPIENLAEAPKNFNLPDGSHIALNTQSTITYPEKFDQNKREVELKGEAFFDVEHNPEKPFIIKAGEIEVRVLGTSFNVKAFDENGEIEVSVKTGRVMVSHKDEEVILTAGQETIFNKEVKSFEEAIEADPNADSWNTGLVNLNRPIEEIIQIAQDFYKVNIEIENTDVGECLAGGSDNFDMNRNPLNTIFELIQNSRPVQFEETENGYILKGESCN